MRSCANLNCRYDDSTEVGDLWVFVAEDADTKLIASYQIGKRSIANTMSFIGDSTNWQVKIQLNADGLHFYTKAVPEVLGLNVDFAQLIKSQRLYPRCESVTRA
jgi:hypothetical protein